MSVASKAPRRRRWRAPNQHGGALVEPAVDVAISHLGSRGEIDGADSVYFCGIPLSELRRTARREFIESAWRHTSVYRHDVAADFTDLDRPILLSGHQPELFHTGVWFKNFVLHDVARRCGAAPIHLNIDNDLCSSVGVRVPAGDLASPHVDFVAMDQPTPTPVPYEERNIQDPTTFAQFAENVARRLSSFANDPILCSLWPVVLDQIAETQNIGELLSRSRHQLEATWGLETCEMPLSTACDTDTFRRFALEILRNAESFAQTYNAILADYRQRHRLRSRTHPVPNLAIESDWIETPFWVWTTDQPQRMRLFASYADGCLRLQGRSTHHGLAPSSTVSVLLPADSECDGAAYDAALETWRHWRHGGLKIRPRALMTTLYSRLFVGDLFLHGIGGSKYDEMTDELSRRFFAVQPPPYMTVTATFKLPVSVPPVADDDVRRIDGELRELWYHPEKYVTEAGATDPAESAQLAANKRQLVNDPSPPERRKWRHDRITEVNDQLRQRVSPLRDVLLEEQSSLVDQLSAAHLLESREFSFCLFSEETLRKPMIQLARRS